MGLQLIATLTRGMMDNQEALHIKKHCCSFGPYPY